MVEAETVVIRVTAGIAEVDEEVAVHEAVEGEEAEGEEDQTIETMNVGLNDHLRRTKNLLRLSRLARMKTRPRRRALLVSSERGKMEVMKVLRKRQRRKRDVALL